MGNVRIWTHGVAIISAITIGVGLLQNHDVHATASAISSATPVFDVDPEFCQQQCDFADWVCGTTTNDGIVQFTEGFSGPVSRAVWIELSVLIDDCIDVMLDILDPNVEPSLDPIDAGSNVEPVDTSNMTTEQIAGALCERALALKDKACSGAPLDECVGELVHQSLWLLEDLYDQADPR